MIAPLRFAGRRLLAATTGNGDTGYIEIYLTDAERAVIIRALRNSPLAVTDPARVAELLIKLGAAEPEDDVPDDADRDLFTAQLIDPDQDPDEPGAHLDLVVVDDREHQVTSACCRDVRLRDIPSPQTRLPGHVIDRLDKVLGAHGYRRIEEWKMGSHGGLVATVGCRPIAAEA